MKKILIPKIKDAFNMFDSIIDDAYDSKLPDDILIRVYFSIMHLANTSTLKIKFLKILRLLARK
ncbi:MAG: hypothetical protein CEE42_04345 [Promethearchaeota archaeon Loki_b31]|nr:MAG: hypothetical protein CEE42_04345 [Candidatus Lokiarchaeota archaeon Loki_b31]